MSSIFQTGWSALLAPLDDDEELWGLAGVGRHYAPGSAKSDEFIHCYPVVNGGAQVPHKMVLFHLGDPPQHIGPSLPPEEWWAQAAGGGSGAPQPGANHRSRANLLSRLEWAEVVSLRRAGPCQASRSFRRRVVGHSGLPQGAEDILDFHAGASRDRGPQIVEPMWVVNPNDLWGTSKVGFAAGRVSRTNWSEWFGIRDASILDQTAVGGARLGFRHDEIGLIREYADDHTMSYTHLESP